MNQQHQQPWNPELRAEQAQMQSDHLEHYAEVADLGGWDDMGNYFSSPEYHPSPQIVPDDRVGFDSSGNYHAIDPSKAQRLAEFLNNKVIKYAEGMHPYIPSVSERNAIAEDITFESNLCFEALIYWRARYGGDVRG